MWMHLCRCTFLLFFLWCWSNCPLQGLYFPLSHLGLHLPCISCVTLVLLYNLQLHQLGSLQHYRWRTYFFQNIAAILPNYIMVSQPRIPSYEEWRSVQLVCHISEKFFYCKMGYTFRSSYNNVLDNNCRYLKGSFEVECFFFNCRTV
jgi:hypothetical protein